MIPAAHLNETLKRVLPLVGHVSPARMPRILQAPYLTFEDTNAEGITRQQAQDMGVLDEMGFLRTPFPQFRFCITDSKRRTVYGVAERGEREIQMVAFHKFAGNLGPICWALKFSPGPNAWDLEHDGRMFDTRTLQDVTDMVKKSEELRSKAFGPEDAYATPGAQLVRAMGDLHVKQTAVNVLRSGLELLKHGEAMTENRQMVTPRPAQVDTQPFVFLALYNSLLVLCYEYLAPHNFRARVTPSAEGKSVEWIRAREHYTVIHRHHSANNADVREGQVVTDSKATTRLAHSRRAHTRLLTAAKWKFKRGQRVFVRASWVGPKEWKDTAGQTYQILHELPQ